MRPNTLKTPETVRILDMNLDYPSLEVPSKWKRIVARLLGVRVSEKYHVRGTFHAVISAKGHPLQPGTVLRFENGTEIILLRNTTGNMWSFVTTIAHDNPLNLLINQYQAAWVSVMPLQTKQRGVVQKKKP
jgi:hypothetical protein